MEEVYKPITNFEEKYLISNHGNIKSIKKNKILKKQIINDGYLSTTLCGKPYLIHKLVIKNFSNEKKSNVVDHIDGNKQNNCISNLRHTTFSENI
jgi:23S rRNA A1618 N6-methylase RlmF